MVIIAHNASQKPGYKQTEAGEIPDDWNTASLESICVSDGLVRGPFGGSLKKDFFVKDGFKVYEQRNAIYQDPDLGSYFINESKYKELKRFEVTEGDFIISCSGTIGKIFQIPKDAKPGVINQALLKIKTNIRVIHDEFFFYIFDWDKFQQKIIDNTQGGAMQNLVGMDIFRSISIPLPPLPEQQAIANALSDVDALIASLDKLIDKKRAIKQATMQQLLTGKRRLPGFSGEWQTLNMAENSILKARIGWQGLTTAEYLKEGEYYLVTGTDFIDGKIDWDTCHFVDVKRYAQDKNIQLRVGDVLLTKDGTIGKAAMP